MNVFHEGWFTELSETGWPGQAMSLQVDDVLFEGKSKFQDVCVFKSKTYGTVLTLDGIIQCTDRDEFAYQEMLTHLPINCHPNPEKVLVIGGGDGGVLREVVKHQQVKSVVHCEIDEMVVDVSRKFLPQMSCAMDHPKVTQHIGDGFEFMRKHTNEFDVIITDSSDPEGPAEALFQKQYFELMKGALREGGILCSQGQCMWLEKDLTLMYYVSQSCTTLFPVVDYAFCTVPTYTTGSIGFLLCSMNTDTNFREPLRKWSFEDAENMNCRYYNGDVHKASFVVPQFVQKALKKSLKNGPTEKEAK